MILVGQALRRCVTAGRNLIVTRRTCNVSKTAAYSSSRAIEHLALLSKNQYKHSSDFRQVQRY